VADPKIAALIAAARRLVNNASPMGADEACDWEDWRTCWGDMDALTDALDEPTIRVGSRWRERSTRRGERVVVVLELGSFWVRYRREGTHWQGGHYPYPVQKTRTELFLKRYEEIKSDG
jgi:hypothetical protein